MCVRVCSAGDVLSAASAEGSVCVKFEAEIQTLPTMVDMALFKGQVLEFYVQVSTRCEQHPGDAPLQSMLTACVLSRGRRTCPSRVCLPRSGTLWTVNQTESRRSGHDASQAPHERLCASSSHARCHWRNPVTTPGAAVAVVVHCIRFALRGCLNIVAEVLLQAEQVCAAVQRALRRCWVRDQVPGGQQAQAEIAAIAPPASVLTIPWSTLLCSLFHCAPQ